MSLSTRDDWQGSLRTASNFFMNLKRVLAPGNNRDEEGKMDGSEEM